MIFVDRSLLVNRKTTVFSGNFRRGRQHRRAGCDFVSLATKQRFAARQGYRNVRSTIATIVMEVSNLAATVRIPIDIHTR
jgi:hypothetical protein